MSNELLQRVAPLVFALYGLPASSRAAVIYVEQDRRVESAVGNNHSEFFGRQEQVAPDFAPFAGHVSSHAFDPFDLDEVTSTVTQASRLDGAGAFASGALGVVADGDFGRGSSRFSIVFDVTGSAYDFTLHYALSADGQYNLSPRPSFHATVALERLDGPGGAATPVVAPREFDLFTSMEEGPTAARDSQSGILAPGRYALRFDMEMFATDYERDYDGDYDLSLDLTDTGHAGLPGDANGDNRVDALDLAAVRRHWHSAARGWSHGDFTADGVVDANDLLVLRRHFGESLNGADIVSAADQAALAAFETSALPDPSGSLLALPSALLLLRRERSRRGIRPI